MNMDRDPKILIRCLAPEMLSTGFEDLFPSPQAMAKRIRTLIRRKLLERGATVKNKAGTGRDPCLIHITDLGRQTLFAAYLK